MNKASPLVASLIVGVACSRQPERAPHADGAAPPPSVTQADASRLGPSTAFPGTSPHRLARPLRNIASSASGAGTCAIDANGAIACFGLEDRSGIASRNVVTPVLSIGPAVQISVGRGMVCGVSHDGSARCATNEPSAADSVKTLPLADVQQVAIADDFGCALRREQSVWCWLREGDPRQDSMPAKVQGLRAPRSISSGGCAIEEDGQVLCWQPWSVMGAPPSLVAARVGTFSDAEEVVGAIGGACVRRRNGTVWCWGDNTYAQCGQAHPLGNIASPLQVQGVERATALALGRRHACALVAGGDVVCWGDDSVEQLGIAHDCEITPQTELSKTPPPCLRHRPKRVPDLSGATRIAAGRFHTCALGADGEASCWGGGYSAPGGGADRIPW